MSMYYPPTRPDELVHWGIKKGEEAKKHKYFARIITGVKNGQNVYRYFYDKKEWDAYVSSQKQNRPTETIEKSNDKKIGDIYVTHDDGEKQVVQKSSPLSFLSRLLFGAVGSAIVEKGKEIVSNLINKDSNVTVTTQEAQIENPQPYTPNETRVPDKPNEKTPSNATDETVQKRIKAADENGGIENPEGEKKYKYIAKIPMGDGTFRYFYSQEDLRAYYEEVKDPLLDTLDLKKDPAFEGTDSGEINEKYNSDPFDPEHGDEFNCYSCSLAYELRRRGYDADSILDDDGETYETITKFYDAPIEKPTISTDVRDVTKSMEDKMLSEGDGASGHIMVYWRDGSGGHDMTWQVSENQLYIIDNQDGSVYYGDYIPALLSYTAYEYDDGISWQRTDNADLNYDLIKKYIRKN